MSTTAEDKKLEKERIKEEKKLVKEQRKQERELEKQRKREEKARLKEEKRLKRHPEEAAQPVKPSTSATAPTTTSTTTTSSHTPTTTASTTSSTPPLTTTTTTKETTHKEKHAGEKQAEKNEKLEKKEEKRAEKEEEPFVYNEERARGRARELGVTETVWKRLRDQHLIEREQLVKIQRAERDRMMALHRMELDEQMIQQEKEVADRMSGVRSRTTPVVLGEKSEGGEILELDGKRYIVLDNPPPEYIIRSPQSQSEEEEVPSEELGAVGAQKSLGNTREETEDAVPSSESYSRPRKISSGSYNQSQTMQGSTAPLAPPLPPAPADGSLGNTSSSRLPQTSSNAPVMSKGVAMRKRPPTATSSM